MKSEVLEPSCVVRVQISLFTSRACQKRARRFYTKQDCIIDLFQNFQYIENPCID